MMEQMVFSLLKPQQKESLIANKELDFSFGIGGGAYGNMGRFRTNIYFKEVIYLLPSDILSQKFEV